MFIKNSPLTLALLGLSSVSGLADKSEYNLFNPTPRAEMRELSPDRPDVTESPITVDAGHVVFEVSVFDWRKSGGDESSTLFATNAKVGLTNNTDIQFVFDSYTSEDLDDGSGEDGISDLQIRLKYNLWGNDSGDSALALFPYVKIPTGSDLSNDEWEGGLIVPFGTQLSEKVSLGLMGEVDIVYNDEDDAHEVEFLHSIVFGFDVTDRLGHYLEYFGIVGEGDYQAFIAGGFTYSINEDLTLDFGSQFGLNDAAEDIGLFSGFTTRF